VTFHFELLAIRPTAEQNFPKEEQCVGVPVIQATVLLPEG
jgi:hypothetical protein